MTDHGPHLRIVLAEPAADHRLHAEHIGQSRRRPSNLQPLPCRGVGVADGDADPGDPEHAHALEDATVLADEEIAAGIRAQLLVRLIGRRKPHHRDAIGVRIRKRPQERGVDEAEDQRVRTDTERQAPDRCEGKCRPAAEGANGVAHVGEHILEPPELPRGAGVLGDPRARAEFGNRARSCVGARIPLLFEFVGAALDVELQLRLELPIEAPLPRQIAETMEESAPRAHRPALLGLTKHRRNRVGDRIPARRLALQLLPSRTRQAVVLRVAVVLGGAPL